MTQLNYRFESDDESDSTTQRSSSSPPPYTLRNADCPENISVDDSGAIDDLGSLSDVSSIAETESVKATSDGLKPDTTFCPGYATHDRSLYPCKDDDCTCKEDQRILLSQLAAERSARSTQRSRTARTAKDNTELPQTSGRSRSRRDGHRHRGARDEDATSTPRPQKSGAHCPPRGPPHFMSIGGNVVITNVNSFNHNSVSYTGVGSSRHEGPKGAPKGAPKGPPTSSSPRPRSPKPSGNATSGPAPRTVIYGGRFVSTSDGTHTHQQHIHVSRHLLTYVSGLTSLVPSDSWA